MQDLESWRREQIVSDDEYEGMRKRYERLLEREDAWILEARRLTLPQVTLYLGAWLLAVGAAFLTFFPYPALAGAPAVLIAWAAALPAGMDGYAQLAAGPLPHRHRLPAGLCLLAPIAMLVTVEEAGLFRRARAADGASSNCSIA